MGERRLPKVPLTSPSILILSIGNLQERLARVGAAGVRFIIVNEKSPLSQALHGELELHAPPGIPVYRQQGPGPDIWSILGGTKDDFLVYDRCGRLTFHVQLPFSFLHFPYVESAIRFTHWQDHCGNCSFYSTQVRPREGEGMTGGSHGRPGLKVGLGALELPHFINGQRQRLAQDHAGRGGP
uniref:Selenoprotein P N-terminal domain-containing protein n=1 Tax=Vombatus ursinus TaxID=29139 RepID=A0A4X2LJI9_VOMUR